MLQSVDMLKCSIVRRDYTNIDSLHDNTWNVYSWMVYSSQPGYALTFYPHAVFVSCLKGEFTNTFTVIAQNTAKTSRNYDMPKTEQQRR